MSAARDRIVADLERQKRFLDFTDNGVGHDLSKIMTDGVLECIIGQNDTDGNPWPALNAQYARDKARRFPGRPMAVLHLTMAQPQEVAGEVEVSPAQVVTTFGVSEDARAEASWFQEGDPARNRPERRFWGFTDRSIKVTTDYLTRRFKAFVS